MSNNLMTSRKFAPLFWTQFFAAFNDNFLKNTLVFLILAKMSASEGASMITLAGAIFMAPFLLLSALGGQLADKFDKAVVARNLKLAELVAAALAVLGIAISSVPVMITALFLFGVGSTLFGPVKYGILPDHLEKSELPKANAWIEGATFIAILAGTIFAGISFASGGENPWVFGPLLMGFALISYIASRFIPNSGQAAPNLIVDKNIFRSTYGLVAELKSDSRLMTASMMTSWFWFFGAIILSILPPLVAALGGNEIAITAYLTVFAVSIAIGSAIAAWFSAGKIVLLPAVVGTFLVGIFSLDLGFAITGIATTTKAESVSAFFGFPGTIHVAIDLALIAIAGAFLVVPTFAALQAWAAPERRARAIAANNVLNSIFMVVGGLAVAGIQALGASLSTVTALLGLASIIASLLMFIKLPTNPVQDFISVLFRAFFRLEIQGMENIEKAGPTPIFALNHVSFLDAPLATILTNKDPIFAINSDIATRWWVRPFLKPFNALPLDPSKPMATRTLIRAVEAGSPLVIFPEGRITVTGTLMKVYDGAAMVADKTNSMIVPIKIEGLEKTFFSRLTASQGGRKLFPKVTVKILEPVHLTIDPELKGRRRRQKAGAELYGVMSDLVFKTSGKDDTILEEVINSAREFGWKKIAVEDPISGALSYGKLLTGARVLGSKFTALFPKERVLGVMLPNANGTAVTLLGLMSVGKIPAMINFSSGVTNILSACKAAEIKTVLTSRAFIEQAKLGNVVAEVSQTIKIIYLDDVRTTVTSFDKIKGLLNKAKPIVKTRNTDHAVILFTSGSEGTPKGVVLTHKNILANASQAAARIDFHTGDKVFNVLPVFHSFGLTAGLILPLVSGVPVYLYPSPLHYRIVPELIYGSNATIIFGTDTFLKGYARTAHPYDFRSIRYAFAGAEPVQASTREIYMNKFGIRILEGYGVTETSPVLAINTPMYNKAGSVGKLLPGIEARLEPFPGVEDGGRLYVKGPNVMAGYYRAENPGVLEAPVDGWHDTGDVVGIDEEGFVTIKDRAKRFAKLGGEMVSLAAVETVVSQLWPGHVSSVTAIPDPRKGEKLILVTEYDKANRADLLKFAKSKGLSELSVPSEVVITKVPVLGSGKIDFVGVKNLVLERLKDAA